MRVNEFVPDSKIFDSITVKNQALKDDKPNVTGSQSGFMDLLKENLDKVNDQQLYSDDMAKRFIKGDDLEIHDVMLAEEEAKLSLQMAVQVRNKIVEAYQELSRMQL